MSQKGVMQAAGFSAVPAVFLVRFYFFFVALHDDIRYTWGQIYCYIREVITCARETFQHTFSPCPLMGSVKTIVSVTSGKFHVQRTMAILTISLYLGSLERRTHLKWSGSTSRVQRLTGLLLKF